MIAGARSNPIFSPLQQSDNVSEGAIELSLATNDGFMKRPENNDRA